MVDKREPDSELPVCVFFQVPKESLEKEGVASALQSFETAVMLMAYDRWPSIAPLIWGACEALLRVKYRGNNEDIWIIQDRFHEDNNVSRALGDSAHRLRKLRNEIAHKGYMPRDTPRCIELFFNAGVPYFDCLLKYVIGYGLFDILYPKGAGEIWDVFKNTRKVVTKRINRPLASTKGALLFLTLKVRETFSPTYIPDALWELQDSEQDGLWESEMRLRNQLIERINKDHNDCFELSGVSCPVCGSDVLASCSWKGSDPNWKLDRLNPVGCYKCSYLTTDEDLIDVFFHGQLTEEQIASLESETVPPAQTISV